MKAATTPVQRPHNARLLVVDAAGHLHHAPRSALPRLLRPGDLLVANDAATLPASLGGVHAPSGEPIEVRLAGRHSLAADDVHEFTAIVFGAGDHRTRTEDRAAPPPLHHGDVLSLGPLHATVVHTLGHPRLISLRFEGTPDSIWAGLARHGKPIQYAHMIEPLAMWDVWTRVAARPVAFEPPSAGFVLDWQLLQSLRGHGIGFATLTHAAGISSTGDATLDARLPFDEPYHLPDATVQAVSQTRMRGGRIVALGTTVTRALEHAASSGSLRSGPGLATQRIGPQTRLRVVDALLSGTHEPGASHHTLLQAFVSPGLLRRIDETLASQGYRTHEFGDSVLVEHTRQSAARRAMLPAIAHGS